MCPNQRFNNGHSIYGIERLNDYGSISMNIVEEHIFLKQEAARERLRNSQDEPNLPFLNLDAAPSPAEAGCEKLRSSKQNCLNRKTSLSFRS